MKKTKNKNFDYYFNYWNDGLDGLFTNQTFVTNKIWVLYVHNVIFFVLEYLPNISHLQKKELLLFVVRSI